MDYSQDKESHKIFNSQHNTDHVFYFYIKKHQHCTKTFYKNNYLNKMFSVEKYENINPINKDTSIKGSHVINVGTGKSGMS